MNDSFASKTAPTKPTTIAPDPSRPVSQGQDRRSLLSVSQLNALTKNLIETQLPLLWVQGEISNLSTPSSGHWYFTLKDDRAQVRCAMFRSRNREVKEQVKQGDQVIIRARVSLYEARGDYQLIAEHMEPAGLGSLQRQFDQLKAKLHAEGLFNPDRKQAIPKQPLHVGVITSPTGAAVRDIISVLKRRAPWLPVTVVPAVVQGNSAPAQLIFALNMAEASGLFDLLILARGGGSIEDLWCFNDEALARAIANCRVPIISAVGHEIDFSIADFVADYRAPTPSAAAEIITVDRQEIFSDLSAKYRRLVTSITSRLQQQELTINYLKARIKHPGERIQNRSQQLDSVELRLFASMRERLARAQSRTANIHQRLSAVNLARRVKQARVTLAKNNRRLAQATQTTVQRQNERLGFTVQKLNAVSPLAVLERGYAIVTDQSGTAVTHANSLEIGDSITITLAEGKLEADVKKRLK